MRRGGRQEGGGVRPRSYRGTHPRFASGTLMSLPEGIATPRSDLVHARLPRWRAVFSGCALRVSHGRSPPQSKEKAERPGDGCPCVGAEETCGVPSQPARRRRTPPLPHRPHPLEMRVPPPEPVSCRSYPAAHSREREPNAPRSAQPPASNQRQRPPRRCRCAPPARAPPNRQCR
mgnify:CR=1 FL=1